MQTFTNDELTNKMSNVVYLSNEFDRIKTDQDVMLNLQNRICKIYIKSKQEWIYFKVASETAKTLSGYRLQRDQYDNNKFGDVPYWHCRNSWGPKWGNCGFFKMAMYPFNMVSQFDHLVYTSLGGPVGGVVMIKTRTKPKKASIEQISQGYLNAIKRVRRDEYYQANADEIVTINGSPLSTDIVTNPIGMNNYSTSTESNIPILILLIILVVILGLKLI